MKFLCFFLEDEDFEGGLCCRDAFVDKVRLSERLGGGDVCLGDAGAIWIVEDKRLGSMVTSPCGGLES